MPPSKAEKAAMAAARKAAAQEEAGRRKAEAEARKKAAAEEEAAASANGMGSFMLQGNRGAMEDRAATTRLSFPGFLRLAAVYDGHVGEGCAEFAQAHVPHLLMQTAEFGSGDYGGALTRTLERTHEQFLRDAPPSDMSGSVATLALITDGQLYVASVGNGRCVVCSSDGKATALTSDNRHEVPHRGLFGAEQPSAERKKMALGPTDAFVILASDGVWDVFSNQKAAEIVRKALQAQPLAPHLAAKALCEQAYQAESGDNICASILPFVAHYYGIEYEVECPVGAPPGESFTVEIEDYRGVRPKRATIRVPDGCYPGSGCIITVDPSNHDGSLEEYEIDVPDGCGPGSIVLVELPAKQ